MGGSVSTGSPSPHPPALGGTCSLTLPLPHRSVKHVREIIWYREHGWWASWLAPVILGVGRAVEAAFPVIACDDLSCLRDPTSLIKAVRQNCGVWFLKSLGCGSLPQKENWTEWDILLVTTRVLLIYKAGRDAVNQALSLARRSSPDEFSLCQGVTCAASLRNPCSTVNLSI